MTKQLKQPSKASSNESSSSPENKRTPGSNDNNDDNNNDPSIAKPLAPSSVAGLEESLANVQLVETQKKESPSSPTSAKGNVDTTPKAPPPLTNHFKEAEDENLEPNPLQFFTDGKDHNEGEDSLFLLEQELAANQDLVDALLHIGDSDSDDNDDENNNTAKGKSEQGNSLQELPDIDIDGFEGDDDDDDNDNNDFLDLLDPDHWGGLFESRESGDTSSSRENKDGSNDDEQQQQQKQQGERLEDLFEDPHVDIDHDTEQLYQELAQLSLDEENLTSDGLPPWFFCQPCTPIKEQNFDPLGKSLPPVSEDEPLSDDHIQLDRSTDNLVYDDDQEELSEDNLLKLSLLKIEEDDNLIREMESQQLDEAKEGGVRPEAFRAAQAFLDGFGVNIRFGKDRDIDEDGTNRKERSCLGHKEKVFGVTFSKCGRYFATASQDSTIRIWDVKKNVLMSTLKGHSTEHECLRVAWASLDWASDVIDREKGVFSNLLASSGADGLVKLWSNIDPETKPDGWKCQATIDHSSLLKDSRSTSDQKEKSVGKENQETKNDAMEKDDEKEVDNDEKDQDAPQIYALEFIDHWQGFSTGDQQEQQKNSFLLTSADDFIHFWEVETIPFDDRIEIVDSTRIQLLPDVIKLKEVMSLHFGALETYGYGVTVCNVTGSGLKLPNNAQPNQGGTGFGGERNPDNLIFVFDANYCPANGLLGVALSDGSLRLVNGRGMCISILKLPGCQSHLTSFSWDRTGTRIATSVATGHLISWKLDIGNINGQGPTVATCAAIYEGGHQRGRPLFGSRYCGAKENLLISWSVDGTLSLWDSFAYGNVHSPIGTLREDEDYPIYAVEVSQNAVVVAGGSEGGFIGVPVFLYDIKESKMKRLMSSAAHESKTEPTAKDANEMLDDEKKEKATNNNDDVPADSSRPRDKKVKIGD